jgi:hypothetical protein
MLFPDDIYPFSPSAGAGEKKNLHINLRVAVYRPQMTSIRLCPPQEPQEQEKKTNLPKQVCFYICWLIIISNYLP